VHLAHIAASLGPQWLAVGDEADGVKILVPLPQLAIQARGTGQLLHVTPGHDPVLAEGPQALGHVDGDGGIGVGARGVVEHHGLVLGEPVLEIAGRMELDLAEGDLHPGKLAGHMDLGGGGEGLEAGCQGRSVHGGRSGIRLHGHGNSGLGKIGPGLIPN